MFLKSNYPVEQSKTLHVLAGSGNSKMAASKPGSTHILACRQDRNTTPKTISMILRSSYPIKQTRTLGVLAGSGNSKMVSSEPNVSISRLVDMMGHNSNGYIHVFGVRQHGETSRDTFRRLSILQVKASGRIPEVNSKYCVYQLVYTIATKFQRLYPCFRVGLHG